MKNFKLFLRESVNIENLEKTINRFYEISGIDSTAYYLKAGSPVFALGLFHLLNKNAGLLSLSDGETENLHIVVKMDNFYWDINGKGTLIEKEEYIPIIGQKKWEPITEEQALELVESTSEVMDVFVKLKNIYTEKQFE